MASAVFLYHDQAVTGLLSGGSWLATLPLANAQDPDIGVVARSTDAQNASTWFTLDLGALRGVGGLAVGPTNISPGASYRIRAYSDSALSELVYDTGVTEVSGGMIDWNDTAEWLEWENSDFWDGYINPDRAMGLAFYMYALFPASITAQYFFVEFFDADNPDGYMQFGRVLCGKAWRPTLNYATDSNSFGVLANTDMQQAIDGNRVFWEHPQRRVWSCSFPSLPENEAFDNVFPMSVLSGVSRQVFLIPDPDDATRARQRNFLATFKQTPVIAQLAAGREGASLDFEEVL